VDTGISPEMEESRSWQDIKINLFFEFFDRETILTSFKGTKNGKI
jgi:hypothetical protein